MIETPAAVLKVLISGTSSTGKTTTMQSTMDLAIQRGIPTAVSVEPARDCPLPLNKQQSFDTSLWLLGRLIENEVWAAESRPIRVLLCDGGPPDILAHTELAWSLNGQSASILVDLARAWQRTYDLVFWSRIAPALPMVDDGLREPDEHYRALIDERTGLAFSLLGLAHRELPPDRSGRCELILNGVEELLNTDSRRGASRSRAQPLSETR